MKSQTEVCEVIITAPNAEWLTAFARRLVEDRLCASGHNIAAIQSIYRWSGEVSDKTEARVALYTRASLMAEIIERTNKEHPYEMPCVVALPVVDGNPEYIKWILAETEVASTKHASPSRRERAAKGILATRVGWASVLLVVVGIYARSHFHGSHLYDYYSTAAQVIVTLYVAVAIEAATGSPPRRLTVEHGIYFVVSSTGLLACIRALAVQGGSWLVGLTASGVVASALILAEAIIHRHAGRWAGLWSLLFLAPVALLLVIELPGLK
jgi:periplasmic divalent cation tolerance protein